MKDRAVFRQYSTRIEAEIVRDLLEDNGIEALVNSDDCGGISPALTFSQGVSVLVAESDLAEAERLLEESIAEAATEKDEP